MSELPASTHQLEQTHQLQQLSMACACLGGGREGVYPCASGVLTQHSALSGENGLSSVKRGCREEPFSPKKPQC